MRMAADLLLRNGSIYSAGMGRPREGHVAITEGRITGVSFDGELPTGPDTRVLDVDGRTVVAGFQDAHIHPPEGGVVRSRCNLHEVFGQDNYERIIREYV